MEGNGTNAATNAATNRGSSQRFQPFEDEQVGRKSLPIIGGHRWPEANKVLAGRKDEIVIQDERWREHTQSCFKLVVRIGVCSRLLRRSLVGVGGLRRLDLGFQRFIPLSCRALPSSA